MGKYLESSAELVLFLIGRQKRWAREDDGWMNALRQFQVYSRDLQQIRKKVKIEEKKQSFKRKKILVLFVIDCLRKFLI